MAKIDSFNFGFIVVDEKQYVHDVIILPDGTVKERISGKGRLGSHTISRSELETLIKDDPDVVLIGTGFQGMARLAHDAEFYRMKSDLDITLEISPDVVKKFNHHIQDGRK